MKNKTKKLAVRNISDLSHRLNKSGSTG